MSTDTRFAEVLELAPDEARRFTPRAGTTVTMLRGYVWLTQEGDDLDRVLAPGDVFVLAHDGVTVVQPLDGRALLRLDGVPSRESAPRAASLRGAVQAVKTAAHAAARTWLASTERHAEHLYRRHPRLL